MFKLLQRINVKALFSQIKKQQIIDSNYFQLADKIALHYNMKQYKNQSGLCLLQLHHQFKIFKPGDWILDVGSGQNYAWSDLALKLTDNQGSNNFVISNDILPLIKNRKNNKFIQGKIQDEQTLVKIALQLQERVLDSILIDLSPQFSGSVQRDGRQISNIIAQILKFSFDFLKKGGTIVYKMLQSDAQFMLKEICQNLFNQTYKYVPSIVRKNSPVCFYVCKGHMISQKYIAIHQFISEYKGTPQKKRKLVNDYKGKFDMDPQKLAKKLMTSQVLKLKKEGRRDKDIIKVLGSDPFLKVQKTLNLLKELEQYQKKNNKIMEAKILNQLNQGDLFKQAVSFPNSKDQFTDMMKRMVSQEQKKIKQPKNTVNRDPLKQGEQYMKQSLDKNKSGESFDKTYYKSDLQGKYSQSYGMKSAHDQFTKMEAAFPQLTKLQTSLGKQIQKNPKGSINEILQSANKKYELDPEKVKQLQMEFLKFNQNLSQAQKLEERQLQQQLNMGIPQPKKEDRPINHRVGLRKRPKYHY